MRREICPLCGDLVEDCNCSVEYGYFQPDYMGRMGSTAAFHHDPEYTWRCYLAADTWFGAEEGKQPCWFHRKMQELVLGIKWRKIND